MSFDWRILTAAGVVWVTVAAVLIVLQRRSAAATLAWLLVFAFLPILGLVLYRLIGPLRLERKRLRRRLGRVAVEEATGAMAKIKQGTGEDVQVARVAIGLAHAPPLPAERLQLFLDGRSTYASIAEAVEAARHHVHLEYYIYEPDQSGTRLRDQLVGKARAGVKVRLLVDGTGSAKLGRRFLRPLLQAGVEVARFNPVSLRWIRTRRIDFRSHRKIVVCDGRVGFTGGMNITDDHTSEFSPKYFRDTHVRVEGAAVWSLQRIFLEDWFFATQRMPAVNDPRLFPAPAAAGQHVVQVVASGPDLDHATLHDTYFTAITRAQGRAWLTTPYFVPSEAFLTALSTASLRGVDVRLLIPERGDSRLIDLAARTYLPELIASGVQVYEYLPRFIHAKTFVIDDDVAIVGTANLDNRSFRLNFELAALIYDPPLNRELAAAFEADLSDSRPIRAADLSGQSWLRRLGEASARLMSPLL